MLFLFAQAYGSRRWHIWGKALVVLWLVQDDSAGTLFSAIPRRYTRSIAVQPNLVLFGFSYRTAGVWAICHDLVKPSHALHFGAFPYSISTSPFPRWSCSANPFSGLLCPRWVNKLCPFFEYCESYMSSVVRCHAIGRNHTLPCTEGRATAFLVSSPRSLNNFTL